MISFTLNDIIQSFPDRYIRRGEKYYINNNVNWFDIHEITNDEFVITSSVKGSNGASYETSIFITEEMGCRKVLIEGDCSCPVEFNCKHVIATLFSVLNEKSQNKTYSSDNFLNLSNSLQNNSKLSNFKNSFQTNFQNFIKQLKDTLHFQPKNEYPPNVHNRLLYVLSLLKDNYSIKVQLISARKLKKGGFGKSTILDIDNLMKRNLPQYVIKTDIAILKHLYINNQINEVNYEYNNFYNQYVLKGSSGLEVLKRILATNRCFWIDYKKSPLKEGPLKKAEFVWEADEIGNQNATFKTDEKADYILPFEPPWYLNESKSECGPLDTGMPNNLAFTLLKTPMVKPEHSVEFCNSISELADKLPINLPKKFNDPVVKEVKPVPVLRLFKQTVSVFQNVYNLSFFRNNKSRSKSYNDYGYSTEITLLLARLSFKYLNHEILSHMDDGVICTVENNTLHYIVRQRSVEANAESMLMNTGVVYLNSNDHNYHITDENKHDYLICRYDESDSDEYAYNFSLNIVPLLEKEGWQIIIDDDYPIIFADNIGDWYLDIEESTGMDWFNVELGLYVDNETLNLLPILLKTIREFPHELNLNNITKLSDDHIITTQLDNGRLLPLVVGKIRNILITLLELNDQDILTNDNKIKYNKHDAIRLLEIEEALGAANLRWMGGERMRTLADKLKNFKQISSVNPPDDFHATLRPYQKEGLNWLQFLREYEFGGILADDMGLGKTVQALAHILIEKKSGRMKDPVLVIAPTSLMVNWRLESQRFSPELKVLILQGNKRKQFFENITDYDIILTTYPLLTRDKDILLSYNYHILILDEAQFVKNPKARATKIVQMINANHRLCLTGTPMENHLGELWSLFNFINPGLLGNNKQFNSFYRKPIEKTEDIERKELLIKRINPFMIRRTKEQVVTELPPKTELIRSVELKGAQSDLYESVRLSMHKRINNEIAKRGIARSQIIILDALLKLRQICCDPRLLKLESAKKVKQSAKLKMLMELIPQMINQGHSVLLFSQFTSMLSLIENELYNLNIEFVKLTGQTKDRATPIELFQSKKIPLFLISLKAGGTGLNLTAADTVIHYDPWWNPAVENQATDRAHRIGQNKPVFVYKMITTGTVEEKIIDLQNKKKQLADSVYNGTGKTGLQLTQKDLNALFEPVL